MAAAGDSGSLEPSSNANSSSIYGQACSIGETIVNTYTLKRFPTRKNLPEHPLHRDILPDTIYHRSHGELQSHLKTILSQILATMGIFTNNRLYMFESKSEFPTQRNSFQVNLKPDVRADIAILVTDRTENRQYGALIVGEVKISHSNKIFMNAFRQLVAYQFVLGKSYKTIEGASHLLGFIATSSSFVVHELVVNDFFHKKFLSQPNFYQFDRPEPLPARGDYFYAQCLTHLLNYLRDFDRPSPPLHFKFANCTTLLHLNVALVTLGEFRRAMPPEEDIEEIFKADNFTALPDEMGVVVKVNGNLFGGGRCDLPNFKNLLIEAKARHDSFSATINALFLGVFRLKYFLTPHIIILMKFIGHVDDPARNNLTSQYNDFKAAWTNNPQLRQQFFDEVYLVSVQAISMNWFHWDLRPANVLYCGLHDGNHSTNEKHFFIVDWDSAWSSSDLTVFIPSINRLVSNEQLSVTMSPLDDIGESPEGFQVRTVVLLMALLIKKFTNVWNERKLADDLEEFCNRLAPLSNAPNVNLGATRAALDQLMRVTLLI